MLKYAQKIHKTNMYYKRYMSIKSKINLIVAIDSKGGISKGGIIPWRITEDMFFFLDVTKRKYTDCNPNVVIMGNNTWKSLPSGLKERVSVVVSSTMTNEEFENNESQQLVMNLKDAVSYAETVNPGKIFIGGGTSIYKEALETLNIDEIYLTQIDHDFECDNIFPKDLLDQTIGNLNKTSCDTFLLTDKNTNNKINVSFTKYHKKSPEIKNKSEQQYLDLLKYILNEGHFRQTRNGETYSKFGKVLDIDLADGFPLLTTKKVFFAGIFHELIFFLKGDTNANNLMEKGVKIWNPNTTREFLDSVNLQHYEEGDMGPMYGFNWSHFGADYKGMKYDYEGQGFNQIDYCLNLLRSDPFSRRILMTTYNPEVAKEGCLFPCHGISIIFHVEPQNFSNSFAPTSKDVEPQNFSNSFAPTSKNVEPQNSSNSFAPTSKNVEPQNSSNSFAPSSKEVEPSKENKYKLSCMMTQRSVDTCCGLPFNIASYALLVHLFCEVLNNDINYKGPQFVPGRLVMCLADVHVYNIHYTGAVRQTLRESYDFPKLVFKNKVSNLTEFNIEDVELIDYKSYPLINFKMVA